MNFLRQQAGASPTAERALRSLGEAVGLARSTIWRQLRKPACEPDADDVEVRHQLHTIALEMRSYGYRLLTKELQRRGFPVNHKRVLRLLRADNLLCLRRRSFICTTDSQHPFAVYPNLAHDLELTNINQLWVSDITYIRLQREFIYLAVILDAYSRRCIGWALSRVIDARLTIAALKQALQQRLIQPGLIHHSDRGVQYAAADYVNILKEHQIQISMSRKGNPYDNAIAERFMRTLKYEEVLMNDYETLAEVRASVHRFIDSVYNLKRLHSSLAYVPPIEFEASLSALTPA